MPPTTLPKEAVVLGAIVSVLGPLIVEAKLIAPPVEVIEEEPATRVSAPLKVVLFMVVEVRVVV